MNAKKRIISALYGGRVDRIPVWLPVVPVTISMMEVSKAPWPGAHSDPEQMARLAAMPWEMTGLPTATVPFCLSLEAEALGCQLDPGTINRTPSVKKRAARTPDEFDVPDDLLARGRIPAALKATEILRERLGDDIVINAKVTGPFTISGHVFGVGNFLSWIKTKPEYVHDAMRRLAGVTRDLSSAFTAHGADVISISDPTSSGDLLSGEYYKEFVFPCHREVAGATRLPTVLHICGYTKELLPYIKRTGFDAYSFEEKLDVAEAKKILGDEVSLIGNIAPVATMLQGTPGKVTAEAFQCMRDGIDLLSSGCTLSPMTPLENIRALVKASEKYKRCNPEMALSPFANRGVAEKANSQKAAPLAEITSKVTVEALLPVREPFRTIASAVAAGDSKKAQRAVEKAISEGISPLAIATDGLLKGMDAISTLYDHRQAYVPEILLASGALDSGMKACGSELEAVGGNGTVLVHTADGDLHDIGKNIVVAIIGAHGYRVIDMGTSVDPKRVVDAVKEHKPVALLGSSLMTSTRNSFLVTADMLKKEGLDVPFIIGGGACDGAFAGLRDNIAYYKDPGTVVKALDLIVREHPDKPRD